MNYTTQDFERDIKTITPIGFDYKKETMGFSWRCNSNDLEKKIVIGYRGYSDLFYPYTPSVSIGFHQVERLMRELFEQTKIKNTSGESTTIKANLGQLTDVNYSVFENGISGRDTFQIVATELKKIFENHVLPFFDRYKTLQDILDTTEKLPMAEMSKFIGQPLPFRRMIIKKLCNDPGYDDYYKMVVDFYKSENSKDDVILAEHLNKLLLSS